MTSFDFTTTSYMRVTVDSCEADKNIRSGTDVTSYADDSSDTPCSTADLEKWIIKTDPQYEFSTFVQYFDPEKYAADQTLAWR